MILPEFIEGIHYRQLKGGKYRFELLRDITLEIPALKKRRHDRVIHFFDHLRRVWVKIEGCLYTICKGYRWNGCSPKRWVPIIGWIGTMDFVSTRLASCVHDTGFQFLRVADYPLSFQEVNDLFRDIMATLKFRLAIIYHKAVEDLGEHFCGEFPERGEHSVVIAG